MLLWIDWLIGVLLLPTQDRPRSICALMPRAQAVEDSQRGTIFTYHYLLGKHININMQRPTTGMPYLLNDKQCTQHITRPPRMITEHKLACSSLRVSTITTCITKSDPTPTHDNAVTWRDLWFQFYVMRSTTYIYTLYIYIYVYIYMTAQTFHVANCHDRIWRIASDWLPVCSGQQNSTCIDRRRSTKPRCPPNTGADNYSIMRIMRIMKCPDAPY